MMHIMVHISCNLFVNILCLFTLSAVYISCIEVKTVIKATIDPISKEEIMNWTFNDSQLAKMKKSIPDMSLPWSL